MRCSSSRGKKLAATLFSAVLVLSSVPAPTVAYALGSAGNADARSAAGAGIASGYGVEDAGMLGDDAGGTGDGGAASGSDAAGSGVDDCAGGGSGAGTATGDAEPGGAGDTSDSVAGTDSDDRPADTDGFDADTVESAAENDADVEGIVETVSTALVSGDAEAVPAALKEGDCFISDSDEGLSVIYKITGDDTVQVGRGSAGTGSAYVANIDGNLVEKKNITTIETNFSGTLTIPSTVEFQGVTYTVTKVGASAFSRYYLLGGAYVDFYLKKIVLPETVTQIESNAFRYCKLADGVDYMGECKLERIADYAFYGCSIREFSLPQSVVYMGNYVFGESSLYKFTFPESSTITEIPSGTFANSNLSSIDVPEYVSGLGTRCFSGCGLGSFEIAASITSMGTYVFAGCKSLSNVTWSEDTRITEIPAGTFSNCTSLEKFEFPTPISSIESSSFAESGLKNLFIPKTLTYLGESAFEGCFRLEQVEFESGHQLLSIGKSLFKDCTELSSIELPGNIRDIGNSAFAGCSKLKTIRIPSLVNKIEGLAFSRCDKLDSVVFLGDASATEFETSTFYLSWNIKSCVFYGKRSKSISFANSDPVHYCTVSFYGDRESVGSGEPTSRFCVPMNAAPSATRGADGSGGTSDGPQAFEGSLASAPDGFRWTAESGFSLDSEMVDSFYVFADQIVEEMNAGDTFQFDTVEGVPVTYTVVRPATDDAAGIASVGCGTGLAQDTAISTSTTGSVTLSSIVVGPDAREYSVDSIQQYAFANCSRFVSVTIPSSVTSIGSNAFYRCTALRNVFFDSDASKVVDDGIFAGCGSIKLVVFGGKKANVTFGSSTPDVYYTVVYYDTKHDHDISNPAEKLLVHERALLDSLDSSQVREGTIPQLKTGYEWKYEDGFSGTTPLVDSCWVYQDGIGFQVEITVTQGNVKKTKCWFRITKPDDGSGSGEVQLGLGKDGITAVGTFVRGVPVIPGTVTDEEGNVYRVTSVGDYAFGSTSEVGACQGLTGVNFQAEKSGITSVGVGVFQNCQSITGINLPVGTQSIGERAFQGCTALSNVNLSRLTALKSIPDYCFYGDWSLRNIMFSSGVESIGNYAFEGCVHYRQTETGTTVLEGITSVDMSRARNLRSIGDSAFSGLTTLRLGNLSFPEGFASVGAYAFSGCGISSLTFPTTTEFIGNSAFAYCGQVKTIDFKGDANNMWIGYGAFNFYSDKDDVGSLQSITFRGKKFADIESRVVTGKTWQRPNFDTGRVYQIYYTVKCYTNNESFREGRPSRTVTLLENTYPSDSPRFDTSELYSWKAESGFSFYRKISDSFYMIAGYNLGFATVTGVDASYSYTGFAIRPVPVLTWVDGTVLVEGVDYVFDSDYGAYADGYVNNKRTGTASIYLKGIGDYAGQKIVNFNIEAFYDSNLAFDKMTLPPGRYVYNGSPHMPKVSITGTVKGRTFVAEEGIDYTVSYRNNVNAGVATVTAHGMGMFSSQKSITFTIEPLNINRCKLESLKGTYDPLTLKVSLSASLMAPWGTELVEGRDYRLSITNSSLAGKGTVTISGIGNYTGVIAKTIEVGGGYGGDGGGTGRMHGTGGGDLEGEGGGDVDGYGSASNRNSENMTSSDVATGTLGGDMSPTAAGAAGREMGGSRYNLFALGTDADIAVDVPAALPYMWLVIMLAGLIVAGMVYRRREYAREELPPRNLGEGDDGVGRGGAGGGGAADAG